MTINKTNSVFAIAALVVASFLTKSSDAQLVANPLSGKRWINVGVGVNNADYLSGQTCITFAKRSEDILTITRVAFSQQLMADPKDSVWTFHNRIGEVGMMWGDGWAGKKAYIAGAVGMGLNVRRFATNVAYVKNEPITVVTIGVPVQIETGIMLSSNAAITLNLMGNWNFREPYLGANLGFTYRLSNAAK
jgi:hypothetical protein